MKYFADCNFAAVFLIQVIVTNSARERRYSRSDFFDLAPKEFYRGSAIIMKSRSAADRFKFEDKLVD